MVNIEILNQYSFLLYLYGAAIKRKPKCFHN